MKSYISVVFLLVLFLSLPVQSARADTIDLNWFVSVWFEKTDGSKIHRWLRGNEPKVNLDAAGSGEKAQDRYLTIATKEAEEIKQKEGFQNFKLAGISVQQTFFGMPASAFPEPPDPRPDEEIVTAIFVIPNWGDQDFDDRRDTAMPKLIA